MTEDGKPYGPTRYKEIVRERYIISKHTNTSYKDLDAINPVERNYLLEFITEELQKQKELYDKYKAEQDGRR